MLNRTIETLTADKFADIFTNAKFRNTVAFAHPCRYEGKPEYRKTCSYPVEYIVTDEQIAQAEAERLRAKAQVVADSVGKLLFTGMGMDYDARYDDDVCNHRIRTYFTNIHGQRYFIELGTGRGDEMRIDHAIDCAIGENVNELGQSGNNFKGLELMNDRPKYTLQNILDLVNKYFDCKFTEIVIDSHNITTEDYISESPR